MTDARVTRRWRGVLAVALSAVAVGLFFERPVVLLTSVVGIAYAAYPRVTTAPTPALELERDVATKDPGRGDDVAVRVRLHNAGTRTLHDVRLVDGVPPMLSVTDGTPRHTAMLRPGESTSFTYAVGAEYGTHRFDPATVVVRDVAGAVEVETTVATETAIECLPTVPDVPLRQQTADRVGRVVTDQGGSGVEFHQTREYRSGDPLRRIDWRRFARTGDLSTVEFRRERAAEVVLCVDAREPAYRAATPDDPHGVAYALSAAEQLLVGLADTTDAVGVASLTDGDPCWLPPGAGTDHVRRARRLLSTHPSLSAHVPSSTDDPPDWAAALTVLRRRLASSTQVVVCSPLTDEFSVSAPLTLEAAGHAVTVVSPDVTHGDGPGARIAATQRANRIHALRQGGVRVVDWDPADRLGSTLVRAQEGWSA